MMMNSHHSKSKMNWPKWPIMRVRTLQPLLKSLPKNLQRKLNQYLNSVVVFPANGLLGLVLVSVVSVITLQSSRAEHWSKSTFHPGSSHLPLATRCQFHLPGQAQKSGFHRGLRTWAFLHLQFPLLFLNTGRGEVQIGSVAAAEI